MLLQGTVSNVAAFGAFVDLGVHQDGLIHVSQLSHRFISDAREVVKTGDIVDVRVVSVDVPRSRIALTMKLDAGPGMNPSADGGNHFQKPNKGTQNFPNARAKSVDAQSTVMSAAFAKLQSLKK